MCSTIEGDMRVGAVRPACIVFSGLAGDHGRHSAAVFLGRRGEFAGREGWQWVGTRNLYVAMMSHGACTQISKELQPFWKKKEKKE